MTDRRGDSEPGVVGSSSAESAPPPVAAVIGGGPGGLMAAQVLSSRGVKVVVFEHMASVGRKFLLAGRGGLNLTHSEPLDTFLGRYAWTEAVDGPSLSHAIRDFPPAALRDWCEGLGHETFVGTSGRVFPRDLRANGLLAAWLERLEDQRVEVRTRTRFLGWDGDALSLESEPDGRYTFEADVTVLALGGASWPRVGSDGGWQQLLRGRGVDVAKLTASNCGFTIDWSKIFRDRFDGSPVKNISVSTSTGSGASKQAGASTGPVSLTGPVSDDLMVSTHGEFMIVENGLEGGVIYAVGSTLRAQMESTGHADLIVDLLPDISFATVTERLGRRKPKETSSNALRRLLGLDRVKIGLLNEVCVGEDGKPHLPAAPDELSEMIKALPLRMTGIAGLDRAISSAGGVGLTELDERFMLRAIPSTFCVGEMIDWDAPTGGYLLQATFSTAVAAAHGALDWLETHR